MSIMPTSYPAHMSPSPPPLSPEARAHVRREVAEAGEPIAPFWPMKNFIHHNPIHGLEHLPFERAVREAKHLLGGNGYLPNDTYRQCHREGRITDAGIRRALDGRAERRRAERRDDRQPDVLVGGRRVTVDDVRRAHLVCGIEALTPALLSWVLHDGEATRRCRRDLPDDVRRRIIEQTLRDCPQCRDDPEAAYLRNLWSSALSALALSETSAPRRAVGDHAADDHATDDHVADDAHPASPALPAYRTVGEWVETLSGASIIDPINDQMIKWTSAFLDEGLAGWAMPGRHEGFYRVWRQLARRDLTGRLFGIRQCARHVDHLPEAPEDAVALSLHRLGIPEDRRRDYLSRHLAQLPGWAGFIRWRDDYPAPHAHPVDSVQYLAVRLFYEVELTREVCRREWRIDGAAPSLVEYWQRHPDDYARRMAPSSEAPAASDPRTLAVCRDVWRLFHLAQCLAWSPLDVRDLALTDAHRLLGWLDAFPADHHGPVWLEAYEDAYREQLLQRLLAHRGWAVSDDARPTAQLVFCIDVRSESFRRHVEAGGAYETFGFAGFFGIPISHQAFDGGERLALCPVLLSPGHAVAETPRDAQRAALTRHASGTSWRRLGHHLLHDVKAHPVGSLMLFDVLGLFFSLGLVGKTLLRTPYHAIHAAIQRWFTFPVSTRIPVGASASPVDAPAVTPAVTPALASGFSTDEQATFVENGLRTMGLTRHVSRLVVLCGHGSASDNNPYFGALDCGACGGNHGDPNARVFAAMGNNPAVRRLLRERGVLIPDDTWFLAGKHNTTTDEVSWYDLDELPADHAEDLRTLTHDLRQAGAAQALERCRRIPGAPVDVSPATAFAHVRTRSHDWANPRPEWGLSGNAAFLIGSRHLTKDLDLEGRVFLHSYDHAADSDGAILEKIMMAPLIVGEWINMEHYFSGVDPWVYGSGSKVIHNVVAGIGVMLGNRSDLQTGLPLQTVNDGDRHYHEPMRLLTVIEAPPARIAAVIQRHDLLQRLFHNQWLNLVAMDPAARTCSRYRPDATWDAPAVEARASSERDGGA